MGQVDETLAPEDLEAARERAELEDARQLALSIPERKLERDEARVAWRKAKAAEEAERAKLTDSGKAVRKARAKADNASLALGDAERGLSTLTACVPALKKATRAHSAAVTAAMDGLRSLHDRKEECRLRERTLEATRKGRGLKSKSYEKADASMTAALERRDMAETACEKAEVALVAAAEAKESCLAQVLAGEDV